MEPTVDLFWIPLGAGGSGFVRFNGRVYERWAAVRQHRTPLHLFHTALRVTGPSGRFLIETMWPSPPGPPHTRGVVLQGPVWWKCAAGGKASCPTPTRRWAARRSSRRLPRSLG